MKNPRKKAKGEGKADMKARAKTTKKMWKHFAALQKARGKSPDDLFENQSDSPENNPVEESPTISLSSPTDVISDADKKFAGYLESKIVAERDSNSKVRNTVLDKRVIATILTGRVYAGDGFSFKISVNENNDGMELTIDGEDPIEKEGNAVVINSPFEKTGDNKMKESMKSIRMNLALTFLAEALRIEAAQQDSQDNFDLGSRNSALLSEDTGNELKEELSSNKRWQNEFQDAELDLVIITLANLGKEYFAGEPTPRDVFFSSLEDWARVNHPGSEGRHRGSALAGFAKNRRSLDDGTPEAPGKMISQEIVEEYIHKKVIERRNEALDSVERLAYEVLTTPSSEVVENLEGLRGAPVPGTGEDLPNKTDLGRKKEKRGALEDKLSEKNRQLDEKKTLFNKKKDGTEPPFEEGEKQKLSNELASLESEVKSLKLEKEGLDEEIDGMEKPYKQAEETASALKSGFFYKLRNAKEPMNELLDKNQDMFCAEDYRNEKIGKIFLNLGNLIAEREGISDFEPSRETLKANREVVKNDGSTVRTREYEGGGETPSPNYMYMKTELDKKVETLKQKIDSLELPTTVKEELKSFADSINKTEGDSSHFAYNVKKLRERLRANEKRYKLAMNPMRAVVEKVAEQFSGNQDMIMSSTYDGGESKEKDKTIEIKSTGPFLKAVNAALNWLYAGRVPKFSAWVYRKASFPFIWLDGGYVRHIPNEDSKYAKLRQTGYKSLWLWGSPLARSWREWDEKNDRTGFGWKALRAAGLSVLGPTFLWTIPHSFTSKEYYGRDDEIAIDPDRLSRKYDAKKNNAMEVIDNGNLLNGPILTLFRNGWSLNGLILELKLKDRASCKQNLKENLNNSNLAWWEKGTFLAGKTFGRPFVELGRGLGKVREFFHETRGSFRKSFLGAAILTLSGIGPAAVGVSGTAYTAVDGLVRRPILKAYAESEEEKNRIDDHVKAFQLNHIQRIDEGRCGWGLQGFFSDVWHHESFLSDSLGEYFGLFPSGYNSNTLVFSMAPLSLPSVAYEAFSGDSLYSTPVNPGWPLNYLTWRLQFPSDRPGSEEFVNLGSRAIDIVFLPPEEADGMAKSMFPDIGEERRDYILGSDLENDSVPPRESARADQRNRTEPSDSEEATQSDASPGDGGSSEEGRPDGGETQEPEGAQPNGQESEETGGRGE